MNHDNTIGPEQGWNDAAANAQTGKNAFRPLKEMGVDETRWTPLPLSLIPGSADFDWIIENYVARGYITLINALPKGGKTTLIGHILRKRVTGGWLLGQITPGRTLIITEESKTIWSKRAAEHGLPDDSFHLCIRPFISRPSIQQWRAFNEFQASFVRKGLYDFVVYDTLANLWSVIDESNASEVTDAVRAVHSVTEAGAGVLFSHHSRKIGGSNGVGVRGSGALVAAVDASLDLDRDGDGNRRSLKYIGRFDETPLEVVLELSGGEYKVLGERSESNEQDRFAAIKRVLPATPPGMTFDEVLAAWPAPNKPGKTSLRNDLKKGATLGLWVCGGTGLKGDPFRYHLTPSECVSSTPSPLGERNESDVFEDLRSG